MCCPGAPRRGGPARDIFNKKTLQNSGKTSESGETNVAANPMGPSGAPSALRGPQCFAKAHVENPWENIGERRFLEVPLCYVRDGIRGEQFPDIFEQKTLQNSGKTSESGKTYYAANPKGPSGAPSAPRGHKSSPRAHVGNPWENKGKLRFRVVPLCRVRGGISGEGFPDSNELAAKFFGNQCFSHVLSIWGRSLAARGSHRGVRSLAPPPHEPG